MAKKKPSVSSIVQICRLKSWKLRRPSGNSIRQICWLQICNSRKPSGNRSVQSWKLKFRFSSKRVKPTPCFLRCLCKALCLASKANSVSFLSSKTATTSPTAPSNSSRCIEVPPKISTSNNLYNCTKVINETNATTRRYQPQNGLGSLHTE